MAKQTMAILRLPAEEGGQVQWLTAGEAPVSGAGTLADAAARLGAARLSVVLPGAWVTTQQVQIPVRQGRRLRQAVPYALEDRLAEDVEELHFALGSGEADGTIPVAIVSRARMLQWLGALEAVGLRAALMVPETLAVPLHEGEWSLLLNDNGANLRMGSCHGWAFPVPSMADCLPLAFAGGSIPLPERLRMFDCRSDREADLPLGQLPVEVVAEKPASLMAVISEGIATAPINLLQGDFSRREQLGKLWRPWRLTAALLFAVLVLQGSLSLTTYYRLKGEDETLYRQIEQVYRDTFPEARNVSNPRVQMERALAAMGSGQGSGFLLMLSTAAPVLMAEKGVELRSLRYQQGAMDFDLTLGDLAILDRLKQSLADKGLEVTIQSASSEGGKVEGRLQIREGQS